MHFGLEAEPLKTRQGLTKAPPRVFALESSQVCCGLLPGEGGDFLSGLWVPEGLPLAQLKVRQHSRAWRREELGCS